MPDLTTPKDTVTVGDAKQLRQTLQHEIAGKIQAFEEATGLRVDGIRVDHENMFGRGFQVTVEAEVSLP